MTRLILKTFFIACILYGLGNYASYLMTGRLPSIVKQPPEIPAFNISKLTKSISTKLRINSEEKDTENKYLYKWRDTNGVMHYTSDKPQKDINYESIRLSNDTNVVPAVSESDTTSEHPVQQQLPSTEMPANVYSPEGIEQLFNQAKDIQNLVNEQFEQQEVISNQE